MPRTRAVILTSIWSDPDFVALTPAAKGVYLALLSQPDVNHLGLLSVAYGRWARALRGTPEWVRGCVAELGSARFVVVDHDAEQLLIRTFLRHDGVVKQPNVLRAARAAIGVLSSSLIAEALLAELAKISDEEMGGKGVPETVAEMKQQLKALVANPSPNPSGNPSPKGSANPSSKGSENPSAKALGDRGEGLGVSSELELSRAGAPARARGTRLPADFTITAEMVAWFRERCPHVDGKTETEKFRNYWGAKSGAAATKLDWPATWRNWMLSAAERLPARPVAGQPPAVRPSTGVARAEQAMEAGRRLQERLDREKGEL